MTFQEFWPRYLKAHRLPGTRALHYFATIIGISASIDAIVTLQPLIFVIGVPLSYCIAIGSHRLIEGNQPLVRVNAAWGALADLRMCWLAIIGRLEAEFAKHRIVDPDPVAVVGSAQRWLGGPAWRHALATASVIGVIAALMDLHDLLEPSESLHYPGIQLGVPVVAFTAALLASCRALLARQVPAAATPAGGYATPLSSRSETSLQRACLVMLVFGAAAFGMAELVEHGVLPSPHILADAMVRGHPMG